MKPKIIVADDSLTIQKVIKITLANEDFDLVECTSEANLRQLVQEHNPLLVLLDFNLSENKTGYDLAKEIRSLGVPKIYMLYGTFDTIDENLLEHSGVSAHIVKPFEGTKFINQCRQLIEDVDLEASDDFANNDNSLSEFPDVIGEEIESSKPEPFVDEDDQWVVNQPQVGEFDDDIEDEYVSDEIISAPEMDSLKAGMQDWGIDIPGVIGGDAVKQYAAVEIPPIIEEVDEEHSADNFVENEAPAPIELNIASDEPLPEIETTTQAAEEALPDHDDLEYPDVDMIKSSIEAEAVEPTSKLISVAELAQENSDNLEDSGLGTRTAEEIRDLEAQIADEVEDNLWAADEIIEDTSPAKKPEITPVVEVIQPIEVKQEPIHEEVIAVKEESLTHEEEFVSADKIKEVKFDLGDIDEDKLMAALGPLVEKMVQKRVEEIVERIAWEVIPDLSENLIKKELEKISQTIIESEK